MIKQLSAKIDGRGMEDNLEIIDAILEERGIEDLDSFLHPTEDGLVPFEKMKNINKAYEIIDDGITMGDKFLILADTDCDGISAGAIITRYLMKAGADADVTINEGKAHGLDTFDISILKNYDIFIVVDSLNNNPEIYRRVTDTGCKLIVLDHHIPSQELLESDVPFVLVSSAVDYPNPELSGAGVVLKMCLYLDEMNLTDYASNLYWLAAVGIVGDMCSMASQENRFIVNRGLAQYKDPAVKKLLGTYMFNTEAVSFSIAPLLNAAVRLKKNNVALDMFLSDDEESVNEIYPQLKACREDQNKIVDSMMPGLMAQIEAQLDKKFMVFHIDKTDADITGLLGNKILSDVQRPLIIIKDCGDKWMGSMRAAGVPNFMKMVNDTNLARCDGHENAAGFECDKDKFDEFCNIIENQLKDIEFTIDVVADIEINIDQINDYLIKQIGALNRISGKGFKPITVLVRTNDYTVSTFSSKKHLKVVDNKTGIILVKWNDMSWQTMKNDKEFIGIGKIGSAYYGRNKFTQVVLDEYTQQND